MLCLDGDYTRDNGRPHFRRVPPPTPAELDALPKEITARIARHLERGLGRQRRSTGPTSPASARRRGL